jgi:hypothetical protein
MTTGIQQTQRHADGMHGWSTDQILGTVRRLKYWRMGPGFQDRLGGVTWRVGEFDFIAVVLPNINFLHLQDEMAGNPPEARKFCGGPPCESEILLSLPGHLKLRPILF